MTKKHFYLTLLILVNLKVSGQDKIQLPKLESHKMLTILFDVKTFNKENEGLWKPNVYENINMPISDDGFCHTVVDTILYTSTNGDNNAIVIFKSLKYNSGIPSTCHDCPVMLSIATFTKIDNTWQLSQFKKRFKYAGLYGERQGYFEIKRLGKDLNCLYHHAAIDGGQGYFSGFGYFYSLENYADYEQVFQYRYYDTNEGAVEKNGYTDNSEIKIIKTESFYKIEITTKRENKGIIKKRLFEYSEELNSFIPRVLK